MKVQRAEKVHTHSIMCNEILIDRSQPINFVEKLEISISKKVKLTVSHTERQSLVLWPLCALKFNWSSIYGLGKVGVAVSWLRRDYVLCLKK